MKKIFVISYQRTGTTSTGKFLKQNGFNVAGWTVCINNKWVHSCYDGDFEKVFNSDAFKKNNVFEDAPWFWPNFYKFLYHRFPNSIFVHLERNPSDWFRSMVTHSEGKTLGNLERHLDIYQRYGDYLWLKEQKIKVDHCTLFDKSSHYIEQYCVENKKRKNFFEEK